jgi:hypothetical protein
MFVSFWIQLVAMPAFRLVLCSKKEVTDFWYAILLDFNIPIYLFVVISLGICFIINNASLPQKREFIPIPISDNVIKRLFVFSFAISILLFSLNVDKMGTTFDALPFHLVGLSHSYRTIIFPISFMLIVENLILRGLKIRKYIFYFIFYAFMEMLFTLSKAIFIWDMLFVFFFLILYYKPTKLTILKFVLPFFSVFIFMYPIIGIGRNFTDASLLEKLELGNENRYDMEGSLLKTPLNRTFMYDSHFITDYKYIPKDKFFDFSNARMISKVGGAARFHTHVVEGYVWGGHHSSGTTGLTDPLLMGGRGLMYILILIMLLLSHISDLYFLKARMFSVSVIIIYLLFRLIISGSINIYYEGAILSQIFPLIILIYLALKVNYRNIAGYHRR